MTFLNLGQPCVSIGRYSFKHLYKILARNPLNRRGVSPNLVIYDKALMNHRNKKSSDHKAMDVLRAAEACLCKSFCARVACSWASEVLSVCIGPPFLVLV